MDKKGVLIFGTFFDRAAEHFDKILLQNKVYTFSKVKVEDSNKRFTKITHNFSLLFNLKS